MLLRQPRWCLVLEQGNDERVREGHNVVSKDPLTAPSSPKEPTARGPYPA